METSLKATQRSALIIATLASFLTPFMGSAVNIALPPIGAEFKIDAVMLGWISTAFILASAMFLVPFGRIADIYGRKRVFECGIILYTVITLLCGFSSSAPALIILRFFQGASSAMIFATSIPILISVYPPERRGHVIGINASSVYLGLSVGPFIGGILTHYLGWRSIFFATVPLGILATFLLNRYLKDDRTTPPGERFDTAGAVMYSMSLVSLMYGFSRLPSSPGIVLTMLGLAGCIAFTLRELRVPHPILHMRLFRENTVFAFSNLAALINYSATFAITFLMSLYLQYIKGMTPQQAGIVLMLQPVLMAVFSPLAGRLSDRIEPRTVSSAGMALTTVGLLVLVFLDAASHLAMILAALAMLGLGFALFASPNTNAVMSSVDKKYYGIASGALGTMRLMGQMMSMGIAMMIFSIVIGRVRITPEYHGQFLHSIHIAFIIFSALCFGGIFSSLARGKMR